MLTTERCLALPPEKEASLQRFHFNVYDGISSLDLDGTELRDRDEARREAIRLSGALLEEESERLRLGEEWYMEVTDDVGLVLFRLGFVVTEAPSLLERAVSS